MRLYKSISLYTLTYAINSGIGFLLLPVFTQYLSPEDYGIQSIFTIAIAFIIPLVGLSSNGAVQVEYFKLGEKEIKEYIGNVILNHMFLFIFFFFIVLVFGHLFERLLEIPYKYVLLIPVIAGLQSLFITYLSIYQIRNNPYTYAKFNTSLALINFSFTFLLILCFKLKWQAFVLSLLISYSLLVTVGTLLLYKEKLLTFTIKRSHLYSLYIFGLPLIPHALGGLIVDLSDRFFIMKMVSLKDLGVYNAGYQIGRIINILEFAFVQAYSPFLFERLKENTLNAKLSIVKVSYLFILGLLLCVIVLHFSSPAIFKFFIGKEFIHGNEYVLWVALGYFFSGVYKMFVGFIFFQKKTYILSVLSVFNIIINIVLNYFLINEFGTIGAAYATMLSFFALSFIVILIATRTYKMPWLFFVR